VGEEIQGGTSFSHALSQYPHVFPDTYVKIIKASEQAGNLDAGLLNASLYIEKQEQAKQKTRRAMIYPTFVVLMAVAVSILLITVVLPPLTRLFDSLGTELPWMTRWLLNVSNFILNNGLQILAAIIIVILVITGLLKLESVKLLIDKLRLKLPLFSSITIERSMQYFCQTTSMLLKAGLRLPEIFDIVIKSNRNRIIRQSFMRVRERLIQGEGFSQPMSEIDTFPPLLVEMVAVGEKSGAMDDTLGTLADYYEKKVDRKIDMLISMLEPTLTVIVGLIVLFLALSIITPMYSILRSMH
jgi:type IV pilus assembly protein PilC